MKSFVASAVLSAAVFAQVGLSASIGHVGHVHGHSHANRRSASAEVVERRSVAFMSPDDVTLLDNKGVKTGKNIDCKDKGDDPVTVGDDGGPFVVEFENKSEQDVVVVVWSGSSQNGAVNAMFVGAHQPDVTHTLQANTTTTVSFNPAVAEGNAISGGFAAVRTSVGLTEFSGQIDDTFGEYTFTTASQFSTTDVSRLINMKGNKMEIFNYKSKADAKTEEPACASTMDKCSFVCPDGANNCIVGKIINCPVGSPNTVSNESGMDGGCAGMTNTGGYVKVDIY